MQKGRPAGCETANAEYLVMSVLWRVITHGSLEQEGAEIGKRAPFVVTASLKLGMQEWVEDNRDPFAGAVAGADCDHGKRAR